jgi:hypothetical protein
MCLKKTAPQIAKQSIPAWKVLCRLRDGSIVLPFYTVDGRHFSENPEDPKRQANLIFRYKAKGFDRGFGYFCLQTEDEADNFAISISGLYGEIEETFYKKVWVPAGARYAIGEGELGFIGAGYIAIRAEQLAGTSTVKAKKHRIDKATMAMAERLLGHHTSKPPKTKGK